MMQHVLRRRRGLGRPPRPAAQRGGRPTVLIARLACISVAVLALALFASAVPLHYAHLQTVALHPRYALQELSPTEAHTLAGLGVSVHAYATALVLAEVGCVLAFGVPALVIFWHRSDDAVGLLVAATGVLYPLYVLLPLDVLLDAPESWRALSRVTQAAGWWLAVVFYYLVPTGRFVPRWTQPLAIAAAVYALVWGLIPGHPWTLANAFALRFPWAVAHFGWFIAGAVAQGRRYREERDAGRRQQIKGLVASLVLIVVVHVGIVAFKTVVPEPGAHGTPVLLYLVAGEPLFVLTTLVTPLAVSVGILRYQLLEIEVILNRTLVYGAVSALLAGVYVGSVLVLQGVVRSVQASSDSPLVVVGATLGSAALFQPLRQRVQTAVDRRFYRRKYDATQTLAAFSQSIRDEVDQDRLVRELVAVIDETLQPMHVSVWLRNVPAPRAAGGPIDSRAEPAAPPQD